MNYLVRYGRDEMSGRIFLNIGIMKIFAKFDGKREILYPQYNGYSITQS